ncbi:hypothetical protein EPA93_26120 [Ktedonosporobacter rubrisoli]|uniref:Uncharacterized protein n=1 Tax=Ktedonosporobacter rubrisoli TaxID=2509675 RepID=A0A4P6JV84_KTERU|nr:hypothetical protein [Ktedonosporobacter rubrisoli]QBD79273.1 hypothetical protein EPA93_26120 [Ktedonosporobacter rubrisoli]
MFHLNSRRSKTIGALLAWLVIGSLCSLAIFMLSQHMTLDTNILPGSSVIGIFCSFIALVEVVMVLRVLLLTRRSWWHFLALLLPLALIVSSFTMATSSVQEYILLQASAAAYSNLREIYGQAIAMCWLQIWSAVTVYILLWFAEKKVLPQVPQRPAWVIQRTRRDLMR